LFCLDPIVAQIFLEFYDPLSVLFSKQNGAGRGGYPLEVNKTNINGPAIVIEAGTDAGVGRVIALSTDKAFERRGAELARRPASSPRC
jgi:hypothetical protein